MRRGFSLIEMMFSLSIGLIVVSALYTLFNGQLRALVGQDLSAEMHQNGRLAMDVLGRAARNAGLGTAGQTTGVFGYGGNANQPLPAILHYNNTGANGSDAVTFVSMNPSLIVHTWPDSPVTCDTTRLNFSTALPRNAVRLAQYQPDDLIMCYDYASPSGFRSWLWRIQAVSAPNGEVTVASNTGTTDFDNSCTPGSNLPMVMVCSRAEVATFYIDANGDDGVGPGTAAHPTLMMDLDLDAPSANDVPVVENIEDLQLAWCLDDDDPSTELSCATGWSTTLATLNAANVVMARLNVIARSSREDLRNLHPGQRPALEDNTAAPAGDAYPREVFTTEVVVRNLRMQGML